jgi:aquaporin related protein
LDLLEVTTSVTDLIIKYADLLTGVGPILGSLIAVFFYKFIKMHGYEMANPGQDGDDKNEGKRAELIKRRQARSRRPGSRHFR